MEAGKWCWTQAMTSRLEAPTAANCRQDNDRKKFSGYQGFYGTVAGAGI
jgi:hypothetical protein